MAIALTLASLTRALKLRRWAAFLSSLIIYSGSSSIYPLYPLAYILIQRW